MKQTTDAKWRADLSPTAEKRLDEWLIEKNYYAEVDGEKFPFLQLTIGQLLHFLDDTDKEGFWHDKVVDDSVPHFRFLPVDRWCDALSTAVKEILEQQN